LRARRAVSRVALKRLESACCPPSQHKHDALWSGIAASPAPTCGDNCVRAWTSSSVRGASRAANAMARLPSLGRVLLSADGARATDTKRGASAGWKQSRWDEMPPSQRHDSPGEHGAARRGAAHPKRTAHPKRAAPLSRGPPQGSCAASQAFLARLEAPLRPHIG